MDKSEYIKRRTLLVAEYIIENKATVRQTAEVFRIGKSTVHKDVTERLIEIDYKLYEKVRSVLDFNKSERSVRGGLAVKHTCRSNSNKSF